MHAALLLAPSCGLYVPAWHGMKAWRMQLRNHDGGPVQWHQAILRYLSAWVSWLSIVGMLWCLVDSQRRSLQDIVSRGARQAPRRRMWYEEEEEALPFHVRDVATGDELVALLSAASGGDGGGLAQSAACAEGTFDGRAGLVVIEVFSRECRACYSLWPKLRMLLEEVSRDTPVTLARVELNAHPQLARAMGVRMLPWVEFHAGGGAGLSRELCSLRGTRLAFPCSLQPHHLEVLREAAGECAPPRCASKFRVW